MPLMNPSSTWPQPSPAVTEPGSSSLQPAYWLLAVALTVPSLVSPSHRKNTLVSGVLGTQVGSVGVSVGVSVAMTVGSAKVLAPPVDALAGMAMARAATAAARMDER